MIDACILCNIAIEDIDHLIECFLPDLFKWRVQYASSFLTKYIMYIPF